MFTRSLAARWFPVMALGVAIFAVPAEAASRHHVRRHGRELTVTRSRGLPVPPSPVVAATPNFTGANGITTDTGILPDGAAGDGFNGFQTPGLFSYGLAGGGLTAYQLQ